MSADKIWLPPWIFSGLLCLGWYLLFVKKDGPLLRPLKEKSPGFQSAAMMLQQSGLDISPKTYYLALAGLSALIFFFSAAKAVKAKDFGILLLGLLGSVYFFWLLRPVPFIFGKTASPFSAVMKLLTASRRAQLDSDLYASLIVLKNLSIVQRKTPLSADTMLEKMSLCASSRLRPLFQSLLSELRTGGGKDAFSRFASSVATPLGRACAGLFSKLDSINPYELCEQTEALISAVSEKRSTRGFLAAQRSGMLTLALATVSILIAMLDFLVVVVYMDLMQMLTSIW